MSTKPPSKTLPASPYAPSSADPKNTPSKAGATPVTPPLDARAAPHVHECPRCEKYYSCTQRCALLHNRFTRERTPIARDRTCQKCANSPILWKVQAHLLTLHGLAVKTEEDEAIKITFKLFLDFTRGLATVKTLVFDSQRCEVCKGMAAYEDPKEPGKILVCKACKQGRVDRVGVRR